VVKNFCTVMHKYPQGYGEKPLAKVCGGSYYAHRLIGKKNFTSQFREGGEGQTEQASIELNEKGELRYSVQLEGEGNTEPARTEWDSEEKRHDSMCRGRARVKPSEFPARRVVERASRRGSRRHGSNRADANESGGVRLGGTFKDAAWVKPSRDRERHQKEELFGEIHKRRRG
jgi:hypothetical protein